ncbi:hypothetical protein DP16_2183 [Stenotrophomonas maltophilia]|nr:hypothetical protein DP16_2183 [Stenotrophomonas maltophilia]SNW09807.1 Uncharacterised protein [Stenotrophomonas maltophilia]
MGMKHSTRTHGQDALSLAIALALAAAVVPAGAAAQQATTTGSQEATNLERPGHRLPLRHRKEP